MIGDLSLTFAEPVALALLLLLPIAGLVALTFAPVKDGQKVREGGVVRDAAADSSSVANTLRI